MRRLSRSLRHWLDETHASPFELFRHFFGRLFESEFVSTPGQLRVVIACGAGLLFSVSFAFAQAYYHKYLLLNRLEDGEPYRLALLADILFIICMAMTALGLFTTFLWSSLFPGLRDYMALAALPVRTRDLFVGKFAALFIAAAVATLVMTTLPSFVLPYVAAGDWGQAVFLQIPGILVSSSLGAMFVFLSLIGIQGILLNILPVTVFPRVSVFLQGTLLVAFVCSIPFLLSIPDLHQSMKQRPGWALWAPPLWFLGLDQVIVRNGDPFAARLAWRAVLFTSAAAFTATLSYWWSYRKHRKRILETPARSGGASSRWIGELAERWLPETRSLAVFGFTAKMLARSPQHRLILTAFLAVALALILEGFASVALGFRGRPEAVIAVPLALALALLAGLRYLFRLPVELRANWVFRIHEPGHASDLLAGMETFLYTCAVVPVALLTLPVEVRLLGWWSGLWVTVEGSLLSLIWAEILLFGFERIPFTASYLPGRRSVEANTNYLWAPIAVGMTYVASFSFVIRQALTSVPAVLILTAALAAGWGLLRRARLTWRPLGRLEFEELPEAAVQTLGIDHD